MRGSMQHRRESRRASHGQRGDTSPEEFRKQLHELADWIANFRQNLGALKVAPNEKPGAILAALPAKAPEASEPFETILADIDRLIVPGMVHWSHPMFFGYFGWTTTAPAILGEIATAPLNVNAMTWRTCPAATELETLVVDWIRQWMDLPQEFGGVVYDTASVGVMHALAVAREEAAPSVRKRGLIGAGAPIFRIYASEQARAKGRPLYERRDGCSDSFDVQAHSFFYEQQRLRHVPPYIYSSDAGHRADL